MFGYRLEPWLYDVYEADQAEKHLNQMAEEGYAIKGITMEYIPIACYKRLKGEKAPRYAAAMISTGDESMMQLFQDAGWEFVLRARNNITVFKTEKEDAKPLFTDQASKLRLTEEAVDDSGQTGCQLGCLISVLLFAFLFREMIVHLWHMNLSNKVGLALIAAVCLISGIQIICDRRFIRKQTEAAERGSYLKRPQWLVWLSHVQLLILMAVAVFLFIEKLIFYIGAGNLGGVALIILCPFIFIGGILIRIIKGWKAAGFALMFLAAYLLLV